MVLRCSRGCGRGGWYAREICRQVEDEEAVKVHASFGEVAWDVADLDHLPLERVARSAFYRWCEYLDGYSMTFV